MIAIHCRETGEAAASSSLITHGTLTPWHCHYITRYIYLIFSHHPQRVRAHCFCCVYYINIYKGPWPNKSNHTGNEMNDVINRKCKPAIFFNYATVRWACDTVPPVWRSVSLMFFFRQVVSKQFNSPIGLYSEQNIADTLKCQASAIP